MARYAGAAKTPLRAADPSMCCIGIGLAISDRRVGFRGPGLGTASGVASINVETQRHSVTLKYQAALMARIGAMSSRRYCARIRKLGGRTSSPAIRTNLEKGSRHLIAEQADVHAQ